MSSSGGDPASFDTVQESSIAVYLMTEPAYEGLLWWDPPTISKIVPALADSWTVSTDGLVYTFTLKTGVKFHNGSPMTMDDVVKSLERVRNPPKGISSVQQSRMKSVSKIEAVGTDKVVITLKEPYAPLANTLASANLVIYPQKIVAEKGDMKKTILGTGAMKFKKYAPGVGLELEKNTDYWIPGRPYLDGVNFHIIPDPAARLAALRTGQVHLTCRYICGLPASEAATLQREVPTAKIYADPSPLGTQVVMNQRAGRMFSDVRLRTAVSLALDRQAAIQVVAEGKGRIGRWMLLPQWGGLTDSELQALPGFRQPKDADIAEAKRLLAAAGSPNGFELTLLARAHPQARTSAIFLASQLEKIGIKARVDVQEDAAFYPKVRGGDFDAAVFPWTVTGGDPESVGFTIEPRGTGGWSGNAGDTKLQDLWDRQLRETNEATRKQLINQIERHLIVDAIPSVPIVWPDTFLAHQSVVRGFVPGATDFGANRYNEVWLAK